MKNGESPRCPGGNSLGSVEGLVSLRDYPEALHKQNNLS